MHTNHYFKKFVYFSPSSPLQCLKKENCIYVPVLKAASTYFRNLLLYNGWEKVDYNDIDWNNNFVFGFIMNPFTRYLKAFTHEILYNLTNSRKFIEDNEKKILDKYSNGHFLLYTAHTIPITTIYGDKCKNINWITLDTSHDATEKLQHMLNGYNIKLDVPKGIHANKSSEEEHELYEYIRNLYEDDNFILLSMLKEDIKLYYSVLINS